MSTLTTATTLVCIVVHQVGVVRNVPNDLTMYPNSVTFPCVLDDNQALNYYNFKIRLMQKDLCEDCFPWTRTR